MSKTIKVKMFPSPHRLDNLNNGVGQVVYHYAKYVPRFGVEFVKEGDYEIKAAHAGITRGDCDVAHLHGLYWGDDLEHWQRASNAYIVEACRSAKAITVPSEWVAETFQRDMRINPYVIPHGIDYEEWETKEGYGGYVLWNKNRMTDVCDPSAVNYLAAYFSDLQFKTTFAKEPADNIATIGSVPHEVMKPLVEGCAIYLSTVKETFGIGVLEAMAAGRPVLGWAYGGNADLVKHGETGYLAKPNDYEDLATGLDYCLRHAEVLGDNGRELVKGYSWLRAAEMVAKVYHRVL